MSTKAATARLGTAKSLEEKARREATSGRTRNAAKGWVRAADAYELAGDLRAAEAAWRRACEFADRRCWELKRRPTFNA